MLPPFTIVGEKIITLGTQNWLSKTLNFLADSSFYILGLIQSTHPLLTFSFFIRGVGPGSKSNFWECYVILLTQDSLRFECAKHFCFNCETKPGIRKSSTYGQPEVITQVEMGVNTVVKLFSVCRMYVCFGSIKSIKKKDFQKYRCGLFKHI